MPFAPAASLPGTFAHPLFACHSQISPFAHLTAALTAAQGPAHLPADADRNSSRRNRHPEAPRANSSRWDPARPRSRSTSRPAASSRRSARRPRPTRGRHDGRHRACGPSVALPSETTHACGTSRGRRQPGAPGTRRTPCDRNARRFQRREDLRRGSLPGIDQIETALAGQGRRDEPRRARDHHEVLGTRLPADKSKASGRGAAPWGQCRPCRRRAPPKNTTTTAKGINPTPSLTPL